MAFHRPGPKERVRQDSAAEDPRLITEGADRRGCLLAFVLSIALWLAVVGLFLILT